MFKYAIRVDIVKADALAFIAAFNEKFQIEEDNTYAWCFEFGKKSEKPHIHGYLETDREIKKSTLSDYMIKHGFKGKYSCAVVKDEKNYKNYIFKDRDIITHTLTEDEFDELMETSMDIESDKKLNQAQKLFWYVSEHMTESDLKYKENNKHDICLFICQYYKENPKLVMPNKSQMFQYIAYILNQGGDIHEAYKMYSTYI